jgi:hypothetical protein
MTGILSQNEINQLLTPINNNDEENVGENKVISREEIDQLLTFLKFKNDYNIDPLDQFLKIIKNENNEFSQEKIDQVLAPLVALYERNKNNEFSQEESDQLSTSVNIDDEENAFDNIEAFEKYLLKCDYDRDSPYGSIDIFDNDLTVCKFFATKGNENILEEIRQKNEAQEFGNIKIPNTDITLINYSFCPKCKTIYSFGEVMNYYMNPKPDTIFKNEARQYREDTRVHCWVCNTYFLPSLIISDGTPKNETQFLCRTQTINAIEELFLQDNVKVLTKKHKNIIQRGNLKAIRNDVCLKDLERRQTLIANMLQYTPINSMMNLIDGTNVEKGDLLFNQ